VVIEKSSRKSAEALQMSNQFWGREVVNGRHITAALRSGTTGNNESGRSPLKASKGASGFIRDNGAEAVPKKRKGNIVAFEDTVHNNGCRIADVSGWSLE
jgi:hypothetical protein